MLPPPVVVRLPNWSVAFSVNTLTTEPIGVLQQTVVSVFGLTCSSLVEVLDSGALPSQLMDTVAPLSGTAFVVHGVPVGQPACGPASAASLLPLPAALFAPPLWPTVLHLVADAV